MALRVLIVDDNPDGADSYALLVKVLGYESKAAYAPEKAFAIAVDWRPDVLLIDLVMPGENGLSLAERIRNHPNCQHCVLFALTAITGEAMREIALQEVFDDWLLKPVDPDILRCRLLRLTKQRNTSADLPRNLIQSAPH